VTLFSRAAVRGLFRHPAFTAVVVATLAVGIGGSTTIFSVVDAVLLRPLPYPDADRLVQLIDPYGGAMSFIGFGGQGFALADREIEKSLAFTAVGLHESGGLNLGGEPAEHIRAAAVTPSFFDALRVRPLIGRTFTERDVAETPRVAVLGHRLWHRRFGADPSIVGRSLILNSEPFEVVGVLPARVEFPDAADVWVPSRGSQVSGHVVATPSILARLAPGVSVLQARDELARIRGRRHSSSSEGQSVVVKPLRDVLAVAFAPIILLLAGASSLVLMVACVNVANLLLVRLASREREFAVRRALGASRGQLAALVLTESLLLSTLAGLASLPLIAMSLGAVRSFVPATLHGAADIAVNVRVLAAAAMVSLLTVAIFGMAPAFGVPGRSASDVLRGTQAVTLDPFWRRFRSGLAAAQIAGAIVLLVAAVTVGETVRRLLAVDVGVQGDQLFVGDLALPKTGYRPERIASFYRRLEDAVRALPGVEGVGTTDLLPLSPHDALVMIRTEIEGGQSLRRGALRVGVTAGYFAATGISRLAGRGLTDEDGPGAPPVMVVSERVAELAGLQPTEMLGRRLNLGNMMGPPAWTEVVGVVRDVRVWGAEGDFVPVAYVPIAQHPNRNAVALVVKTSQDPSILVPALRRALSDIDPQVPFLRMRTYHEVREQGLTDRRLAMNILFAFGALTFALAAVGLYGIISYLVQARTREIGIRIALGAPLATIRRQVLLSGLGHALLGVMAGAIAVSMLSRVLAAWVPGFGSVDIARLGSVAALLMVTAALASWLPARRATRVDPAVALRAE
jgi:putative ABC transport system permease protein